MADGMELEVSDWQDVLERFKKLTVEPTKSSRQSLRARWFSNKAAAKVAPPPAPAAAASSSSSATTAIDEAPLGGPISSAVSKAFQTRFGDVTAAVVAAMPAMRATLPSIRWAGAVWNDASQTFDVAVYFQAGSRESSPDCKVLEGQLGAILRCVVTVQPLDGVALCRDLSGRESKEDNMWLSSTDVAKIQESWTQIEQGQTSPFTSYKMMMAAVVQSHTGATGRRSSEPCLLQDAQVDGMKYSPALFFSSIFYTRFFLLLPDVRWSFGSSLKRHGHVLFRALHSFVKLLSHGPSSLEEALRLFASTHELGRTVCFRHFVAFGASLQYAVYSSLGNAWKGDPVLQQAWHRLVRVLTERLVCFSGAVDACSPRDAKPALLRVALAPLSLPAAAGDAVSVSLTRKKPSLLRLFSMEAHHNSPSTDGGGHRGPRRLSDYSPSHSMQRSSLNAHVRCRSRSPSSMARPIMCLESPLSSPSYGADEEEEEEEEEASRGGGARSTR